jgi:hypothetical protein
MCKVNKIFTLCLLINYIYTERLYAELQIISREIETYSPERDYNHFFHYCPESQD